MKNWMALAIAVTSLCACNNAEPEKAWLKSVLLETPQPLSAQGTKNYSGTVREAHTVGAGFKTGGQISHVYIKEGNYVRQGQLLARLDDADYRLGVEALQIQYNQLKAEVSRLAQLYKQKGITANDYEKAIAGLQQVGVELQSNKNKLAYTCLYAPVSGYVESVNFTKGEMVGAGTAVVSLLDVSHLEVTADIPASDYLERSLFASPSCTVAGVEGSFPMKVISLTPKADGNQLYQLRLAFAGGSTDKITAGMNANVTIGVSDGHGAQGFSVPLSAVMGDSKGNASVWVMRQDSTVVRRKVTLGHSVTGKGRAVVTGGLNEGDRIVRSGVNALQEGEKVRVMEKTSETNVGGLL